MFRGDGDVMMLIEEKSDAQKERKHNCGIKNDLGCKAVQHEFFSGQQYGDQAHDDSNTNGVKCFRHRHDDLIEIWHSFLSVYSFSFPLLMFLVGFSLGLYAFRQILQVVLLGSIPND